MPHEDELGQTHSKVPACLAPNIETHDHSATSMLLRLTSLSDSKASGVSMKTLSLQNHQNPKIIMVSVEQCR